MANRIPLGTRFGSLTVLGPAPKGDDSRYRCHVQCKCGKIFTVRNSALNGHGIKSCGKKLCRGNRVEWTDENTAALTALAAIPGITYGQIATKLGKSRSTVYNKMLAMGLSAEMKSTVRVIRLSVETYPGKCFEDDPRGDSDRNRGRKPAPTYSGGYAATALGSVVR